MTLRHARFDSLPALLDELGHDQILVACSTSGSARPNSTRPSAGSATGWTVPWTCAWTRPAASPRRHREPRRRGRPSGDAAGQCRRAPLSPHRASHRGRATLQHHNATRPGHRQGMPSASGRRAHPARRTFQALRIEVNAELEVLEASLTSAIDRLAATGRCVVLSYHSGEDRIVKNVFRNAAGESPPPRPGLPPAPGPGATVRLLGRRPRFPDEDETAANPRASAARLRAAERLPEDG